MFYKAKVRRRALTPRVDLNSDPNSWVHRKCVKPLPPGTHTINTIAAWSRGRKEVNATINVFSPHSRPLGETFQFLADAPPTGANAIELEFDIEAWG